jgi:prepilin-type N-terminal cleavage/methylation domain-containing protein
LSKQTLNAGFTLIELIIVIVVIGVLAVTAAPKFFDFGTAARTNAVKSMSGTLTEASKHIDAALQLPNRVIYVNGSPWLDVNGDGIIEADATSDQENPRNNVSRDIKLIKNDVDQLGPDNFEVAKMVSFSEDVIIEVGERHQTYIGFDRDDDGEIADDNCRVYFTQPINSRGTFVANKTDGC